MGIKSELSFAIIVISILSACMIANAADITYQQALLQDFQAHDLNQDNILDSQELLLMIKQMINTDMQIQGAEDMEFSEEFYQQAIISSLQHFDEDHNGLDLMEFKRLVESSVQDQAQFSPNQENEAEDYNQQYAL